MVLLLPCMAICIVHLYYHSDSHSLSLTLILNADFGFSVEYGRSHYSFHPLFSIQRLLEVVARHHRDLDVCDLDGRGLSNERRRSADLEKGDFDCSVLRGVFALVQSRIWIWIRCASRPFCPCRRFWHL